MPTWQARAMVVRDYLVGNFSSSDDTQLKTLGRGKGTSVTLPDSGWGTVADLYRLPG